MSGQWNPGRPVTLPRFLYILHTPAAGLLKFGISNNWSRRLEEHQKQRGDDALYCLDLYQDDDWQAVHAAERAILKRLGRSRSVGRSYEWFMDTDPRAVAVLQDLGTPLPPASRLTPWLVRKNPGRPSAAEIVRRMQ